MKDEIHPNIKEFSHLIAHRERNRGRVNNCIISAIENEYETIDGSKKVIGYHGMNYEEWVNEWKVLGIKFNIIFDERNIEEITLCAFSLAQFTTYNDEKGRGSGMVELFKGKDNSLALLTTEGKRDSYYVCFSKFGCFKPCREKSMYFLKKPVEAIRENGKLWLRDADGYILTNFPK